MCLQHVWVGGGRWAPCERHAACIMEKFHVTAGQNPVKELQLWDTKHFTLSARNLTPSRHPATTMLKAKRLYGSHWVRTLSDFGPSNINNRKTHNYETWHTCGWGCSVSDRLTGQGNVPAHAMKSYRLVEVQLHTFITSALRGGEWSASRPGRFTPERKNASTHWMGGWAGHRTDHDVSEEEHNLFLLAVFEPRTVQPLSQSLYYSVRTVQPLTQSNLIYANLT
jgi:hypothetical protein